MTFLPSLHSRRRRLKYGQELSVYDTLVGIVTEIQAAKWIHNYFLPFEILVLPSTSASCFALETTPTFWREIALLTALFLHLNSWWTNLLIATERRLRIFGRDF
jgi:hypothetical protein